MGLVFGVVRRTVCLAVIRVLYFARTEAGEIWLLLIYAKSAIDSIPGHILKTLKEEMVHATR